ncbi:MAG TPA: protein kinase, partial [Thermoanaerobaculia bacterium]|nr:protein kinase [Thermoanaerobaculia bacterium]
MEFRGNERFVIQRRLGEGGFGDVYEVRDIRKNASVALKKLRQFTPESLYRFKREFRLLADITHPNLVQLYELVSDADEWFFTMELIRGRTFIEHVWGGDLSSDASTARTFDDHPAIEQRPKAPPPAPAHIDRLEEALPQLVEGVAALHRAGNIHRDLKPSNVLVSTTGRVVLLDFGMLLAIDPERAMQSIEIAGTPVYMSPEQIEGRALTPASDWYSVGVMLFECLTGELPFGGRFMDIYTAKQSDGPSPGRTGVHVPPHLDALCRDLLRRDEASRPGADEILRRLGNRSVRTAVVVPAPVRSTPATLFVGREREMSELRAAFGEVLAGDRVIVCMHGLSGIGKSALARQFLDGLRQEYPKAAILTGRCFERESVPYKGLDSLIDALARYLRRLPPPEVEALLPRDILALGQLFPVLRQLEDLTSRRRPAAVPDSQELRRRAFSALRDLLARLGDQLPTVLFVDDLQWGDVDSADLLTYVVQGSDAPSLLLLASYRSDEVESSPFLRAFLSGDTLRQIDVREVTVGQLSADESRELAAALLKETAPRLAEAAANIAAEAGGSPFFIDELVRSAGLAGEGLLPRRADAGGRDITLSQTILSRLHFLPAEAERLLQLVSVNGQPVPAHVLKRAADVDAHESALALLRTDHLIRIRETEMDDEIETYHDRIR